MQVMRKQKPRKEFKRCELCNDGSLLAGNHKNSIGHKTKQNAKDALDYGLVRIKIPEYYVYTDQEYSSPFSHIERTLYARCKRQVPMTFGTIWFLETDYSYDSIEICLQREYWVKTEELIETYFEMINTAIRLQKIEEEENLPKFIKDEADYDAFLDKHWHYEAKLLPDLDYSDTLLDLQYAFVQFPFIRKTILVVKEKESDQFTIRTFRYRYSFDDGDDDSIEQFIFGWELARMIEKEGNIIRQGDIYLQPIPNHPEVEFPSEDAEHTWLENGYESHRPEHLGVWCNQVVLKGKLEHPEHKDIMLESWHRIVNQEYFD